MRPALRRAATGVLLGVLVGFAAACGPESDGGAEEPGIRNVLLVTLDTTRADRLGAYGAQDAQTPVLDRLAREGVLFENAIAVTPVTLPSHASILTGLRPPSHGARANGTHFLEPDVQTLAEVCADAGWATGAVVSAVVLDSRYGLDQGFASYDDDLSAGSSESEYMFRETPAADTVRRARAFLAERGDERWFLWAHFFDPHASYAPPEPFATSFAGRPYEGEIAYVDSQLAALIGDLESRGWLDDTLVVVTADHGESLGEHDEWTHGTFLYDATTRVPLLFRHPSLAAGTRVTAVASHVDLVPTIAELTGLATGAVDGVSLAAALRGAADFRRDPVYQESMSPAYQYGWADLRALRSESERFVRAPDEEFYDLAVDAGEETDLLPGAEARAAPYRSRLVTLLGAGERDSRRASASELGDEERLALEELGYVWSLEDEEAEAGADASRPDPKTRIAEKARLDQADLLFAQGRYADCEALLLEVVQTNEVSVQALYQLADAILQQGRPAEALPWFERACALPGRTHAALQRVAVIRRGLGLPGWEEWLALAKNTPPRDPLLWVLEAEWRREEGDPRRAEQLYGEALALDDGCAEAWLGLGRLQAASGYPGEAQRSFERAVARDAGLADGWASLGILAEQAGRGGEAARHYDAALRLDPHHLDANLRRAAMALAAGRFDDAEPFYRRVLETRPANFRANLQLGVVLGQREEHAAAAACFARAAEKRPTEARACAMESGAWRAAGDAERALAAAEEGLAREADSVDALLAAAAASAVLDRDAEATAYLARATSLDPNRVARARAADPVIATIEG